MKKSFFKHLWEWFTDTDSSGGVTCGGPNTGTIITGTLMGSLGDRGSTMAVYINGAQINQEVIEINGVVFRIDGAQNVYVNVEGPVNGNITTTNGAVEVNGSVKGHVKTTNGAIACGNVGSEVSSISGAVTVNGNVSGDVSTLNGRISYQR